MKLFIYSGTHWDREWYQTFQGFRFRLVDMMNDLMDGLENTPDFGVFHADGQTIIFEDFLEIEPHKRDRLQALMQSGKLVIGPWYCMPDEFLCSGESIIKNLRRGMKIASEFGVEPCHNGYICDIFGHTAQTPQIFSGMDLHHAVLGRGTNAHTTPSFFRWTAPDGSDVRVIRLHDGNGYGDFNVPTNGPQDDGSLGERFKAYFDERITESNIPVVVSFGAIDHDCMHREIGNQLRVLRDVYPDAEVYHVSLDEIDDAVDAYLDELPRVCGELSEPAKVQAGYLHLITNTLSSRYPIKRENDRLQTYLEKWIAPAYALGLTHASRGYLDIADKYLLQNHPHDSICGCSIDQVHRDMMYRFDQTRMLGDEIMRSAEKTLKGDLSAWYTGEGFAPSAAEDDLVLRIFNPLPYAREETVTVEAVFPKGYHKYYEPFGYEGINSFRLYDACGCEVTYGITDIITYPDRDVYTLSLYINLTACGMTELLIKRSDMPSRYPGSLLTGQRSAENEHLRLKVNTDGSIDLTDKKSGVTYAGLLASVDDGEIGDGWFHCNPAVDRTVINSVADIEISENTTLHVTFRITQHLHLPISYTRGDWREQNFGIHRSNTYTEQDVVHEVTLAKGARKLIVRTVIDNRAMDHRLRLRLPTGIVGDTYFASQPFCIIPRKTDDRPETADWKEYGCIEKNTVGIVAKYGEHGGFAFVSDYGLHECGVSRDGTIDITLFRAFCNTVQTLGEPDGELQQKMTFSYSILPLDADTPLSSLARAQDCSASGIRSYTVPGHIAHLCRPLMALDGDALVYSTAAPLGDGIDSDCAKCIELRFWNCSDDTAQGTLFVPDGFEHAALTEIDGRVISALEIKDGKIALTADQWKIVTVRLTKET